MSRKRRILSHYEPRLEASLDDFQVLDWASLASQEARFAALADNVPLDGGSLLDVGCGLGDLWAFLKRRPIPVDYTGVDISDNMLSAARRRHKDVRFVCADIFADAGEGDCPFKPGSFDVVFASGIFNLNLGNNMAFVPAAVARLRSLSRRYVVLNLLHVRTPGQHRRYAYYDPAAVLGEIGSADWQSQVLEDYLPNDFTVISRRKQDR